MAAFSNWLADYIFPSSRGRAELGAQGGRPRFQYTNEDARFVGAEAELQVALDGAWVVDATASYVRARFISERAPIPVFSGADTTFVPASSHPPLIPPLNGRVALRYETPRGLRGHRHTLVRRAGTVGRFRDPHRRLRDGEPRRRCAPVARGAPSTP